MAQFGNSWRDFKPGQGANTSSTSMPTDRGSRRGAKRCIVTDELQLLDHAFAKQAGVKGVFFQSQKEAKFYITLEIQRRAGMIRPLHGQVKWRQVAFPLFAIRPDGLRQQIAKLVLDFAYERREREERRVPMLRDTPAEWVGEDSRASSQASHVIQTEPAVWVPHYQDVKPSGGHREDTYLLKKPWFEAQYGITIEEL
jgi:hypothetical protein